MATVVADISMSLDGFIADRNDQVGPLFDWYQTGPVATPSTDEKWTFKTDEASVEQIREGLRTIGALICGRRLFDLTNAWGGRHPMGCPVVVVTHTVPKGWPRERRAFHLRHQRRRERRGPGQGDRRRGFHGWCQESIAEPWNR